MRAIVLEAFGGPDVMQVRDVPEPRPPVGGYVVQLAAIGINFAELVERRGLYRKNQTLPYDLGKEAAGTIVEVHPEARGPGVDSGGAPALEVGQRVSVLRFAGGCYAERVAVEAHQVLPVPKHLSLDEAAAFAIAFATAWYAIAELARLRPGESALVHAAAGSTGAAAIQMLRALGADPVIGAVGSAWKREVVLGLGAHACAAEQGGEDFVALVQRLCGARGGVDHVLESIGGATFEKSLLALAPLGRLVTIGFSSIDRDHAERVKRVHPLQLFLRSWGLFGLNVENIDFVRRRATYERIVRFAEEHDLRPHIGARFALTDAAAAHAAIEARRTTGKVLLVP
jgi:NADPH:quinone reductase-like Zn-dependent oxidoreductase